MSTQYLLRVRTRHHDMVQVFSTKEGAMTAGRAWVGEPLDADKEDKFYQPQQRETPRGWYYTRNTNGFGERTASVVALDPSKPVNLL